MGIPMTNDIAFELSILAGLVIGKPFGVAVFTFTAGTLGFYGSDDWLNTA
jgi:Na+/H+ antiporter NhaA